MLHRFTVELVELLVYKGKSRKRSSVDCEAVDLRNMF